MMNIMLNGNPFEIENALTVNELLAIKKYTFPNIIVRINDVFIQKNQYSDTMIQPDDKVQVIHMISGG
ncbi:MAG TPA: sulfur carrier protein ThiS [Candidatus Cloacimonadota bacterium]|nr:sulfur carrier protein ThiS [Candidatus Cloacimonadota bacterium]HPM03672.1 sulfur carrier protein ThiS [Candidatus Cloacimonadota bacterium]